jgi:hypothetical protein
MSMPVALSGKKIFIPFFSNDDVIQNEYSCFDARRSECTQEFEAFALGFEEGICQSVLLTLSPVFCAQAYT